MAESILRVVVVLCWIAGAALVVTTVRLVGQNRELAARIDAYYQSIALPEGARVPPLIGIDRDGSELIVDSSQEENPILLLVFFPHCPICDENWPSWDPLVTLQRQLDGKVVSVDTSGAVGDEYLEAHRIDSFPVIDSVKIESALVYRFLFTPQTLIL